MTIPIFGGVSGSQHPRAETACAVKTRVVAHNTCVAKNGRAITCLCICLDCNSCVYCYLVDDDCASAQRECAAVAAVVRVSRAPQRPVLTKGGLVCTKFSALDSVQHHFCRLYLHRITSTVISELTRGQKRFKAEP